jgi:acyl carrier protein
MSYYTRREDFKMSRAETIRRIVADIVGIDIEEVTDKSRFFADFGLEPVDMACIILEVEAEFDTDIPDEIENELKTVGDLINCMKEEE